jgi:hypothetical protein
MPIYLARATQLNAIGAYAVAGLHGVIGCVTAMKIRLRTLLRTQAAQADAVASYANSMKGVTCDTSAS